MSPFPPPLDQVLDRCTAEPDRVRPIGEVLTCLLARYQIAVEPASVSGRTWPRVDLPDDTTSHALAMLAD